MPETTLKLLSNLNDAFYQLEQRMVEEAKRNEDDLHYHRLVSMVSQCSKAGCAGIDPVYATKEIILDTLTFHLLKDFPDGRLYKTLLP